MGAFYPSPAHILAFLVHYWDSLGKETARCSPHPCGSQSAKTVARKLVYLPDDLAHAKPPIEERLTLKCDCGCAFTHTVMLQTVQGNSAELG